MRVTCQLFQSLKKPRVVTFGQLWHISHCNDLVDPLLLIRPLFEGNGLCQPVWPELAKNLLWLRDVKDVNGLLFLLFLVNCVIYCSLLSSFLFRASLPLELFLFSCDSCKILGQLLLLGVFEWIDEGLDTSFAHPLKNGLVAVHGLVSCGRGR